MVRQGDAILLDQIELDHIIKLSSETGAAKAKELIEKEKDKSVVLELVPSLMDKLACGLSTASKKARQMEEEGVGVYGSKPRKISKYDFDLYFKS